MAAIQGKHSSRRAQGRRHAHASTQPAVQGKKPNRLSPPTPIVTRRGKTTVRRYDGRSFYRFEEIKGKAVEFVEFFTSGEYHALDVRFQDKTALHFVIEPTFNLKADYADWKTGNWRPLKRWPLISASVDS